MCGTVDKLADHRFSAIKTKQLDQFPLGVIVHFLAPLRKRELLSESQSQLKPVFPGGVSQQHFFALPGEFKYVVLLATFLHSQKLVVYEWWFLDFFKMLRWL